MPNQPVGQDGQTIDGPATGIRIRLEYQPLDHVYASMQPVVELDDQPPVVVRWGETFIPTDAGPHRLRCYFRYTMCPSAGDAATSVVVPEGQVVELTYDAPKVMAFNAGSWRNGINRSPSSRSDDQSADHLDGAVSADPSLPLPPREFVMWGSAPVRWLGVAFAAAVAIAMVWLGFDIGPGALVLTVPVAVLFAAAAVDGILWSLTRVAVTDEKVLVRNVGHREEISRSQVRELRWAPQRLSRVQIAARWQTSGAAAHLLLADGRRISLDCTRAAPSVLKTALPMPSLETGRARTSELANELRIEARDDWDWPGSESTSQTST